MVPLIPCLEYELEIHPHLNDLTADAHAFDLLGFGLSDKPTDYDYSNANQAETVSELAEALNLDSFIVGGHSLGGAIAFHVAMNNQKTKGLILFNPGIINTGVPEFARYLNLIFPFARVSAKQFADRDFIKCILDIRMLWGINTPYFTS